ncbi:MAG: ATP-binding protein [Lachnospiraceae bacterium]|nr:ATP-binding protein [Lachnospiraceae bacterium]
MEAAVPGRAIIFIGLQASGKTTFYHQKLAGDYVHINLDTLHTRNKERLLLEDCLRKGHSFVVDNTNPTAAEREKYIRIAKEYGYETEGYFFRSVMADCVERNRKRSGKACVPDKAIACTSNRLEMPSLREGFDRLYFVRIEQGEFVTEEWREDEF